MRAWQSKGASDWLLSFKQKAGHFSSVIYGRTCYFMFSGSYNDFSGVFCKILAKSSRVLKISLITAYRRISTRYLRYLRTTAIGKIAAFCKKNRPAFLRRFDLDTFFVTSFYSSQNFVLSQELLKQKNAYPQTSWQAPSQHVTLFEFSIPAFHSQKLSLGQLILLRHVCFVLHSPKQHIRLPFGGKEDWQSAFFEQVSYGFDSTLTVTCRELQTSSRRKKDRNIKAKMHKWKRYWNQTN